MSPYALAPNAWRRRLFLIRYAIREWDVPDPEPRVPLSASASDQDGSRRQGPAVTGN